MLGWLLCAGCAKDHAEEKAQAETRDAGSGPAGSREAGARAPARAGESAAPPREPKPPAAGGGGAIAPVGTTATAVLAPTDAHAAEHGDDAMRGKATFRQSVSSVDLAMMIRGCANPAKAYRVFVKEGSDCSEQTLLGPNRDGGRGEGIALGCFGTAGTGRTTHARANDSSEPWSIGGPARSNVVGHALAVYDPDTMSPLACGVIELDVRTEPQEQPAEAPPVERAAPIAGLCTAQVIVRDSEHPCPDPNEIVKCASEHCDLNACVAVCSDYVDCLMESDEPCSRQFVCDITEPCSDCYSKLQTCALNFCADVYACAAPASPDGPCSKLEACCAMQGEKAEMCLELVQTIKKLSGDPSCVGAMQDWDFSSHLEVPCEFE
jgi:hypothetical protein